VESSSGVIFDRATVWQVFISSNEQEDKSNEKIPPPLLKHLDNMVKTSKRKGAY
jgi:hypothetical protein